jgi:hypothetical protein
MTCRDQKRFAFSMISFPRSAWDPADPSSASCGGRDVATPGLTGMGHKSMGIAEMRAVSHMPEVKMKTLACRQHPTGRPGPAPSRLSGKVADVGVKHTEDCLFSTSPILSACFVPTTSQMDMDWHQKWLCHLVPTPLRRLPCMGSESPTLHVGRRNQEVERCGSGVGARSFNSQAPKRRRSYFLFSNLYSPISSQNSKKELI